MNINSFPGLKFLNYGLKDKYILIFQISIFIFFIFFFLSSGN